MLRKTVYPKIEALLNRIVTFLNEKGFSPNQLTLAGLALNFVAGWVYASGSFFFGGIVLLLAGLGDLLDGPLARLSGRTSRFGAFLDSTVDRYSDLFIFGGLALHFAKEAQGGWLVICLGIILGSFVTSYAKTRAENLIENCSVGIFGRAERILTLAVGSIIPILMPFALWILLIGTNATALHRIFYVRKMLTQEQK
ncbi:MAG TPA: CDP-alcohol phosphatidyltransferase family protein [bacterium]|nr:CDP-alcohol phosphatidyltransferase family protein [bacterium]